MKRRHEFEPYDSSNGGVNGLICRNCLRIATRGSRCRNCEEDVMAHTPEGKCCFAPSHFVWYSGYCDG